MNWQCASTFATASSIEGAQSAALSTNIDKGNSLRRSMLVHAILRWKISSEGSADSAARRLAASTGRAGRGIEGTGLRSRDWRRPSSPVTAGVWPERTALVNAISSARNGSSWANRQMAHRIAAVGLEAEALRHLSRQQVAHDIFAAGRHRDAARLERRQPVGVDVSKHAGLGAELQQRDVLAFGNRAESCGCTSMMSDSVNQRIRSMSCTARSITTPTFDIRGGTGRPG